MRYRTMKILRSWFSMKTIRKTFKRDCISCVLIEQYYNNFTCWIAYLNTEYQFTRCWNRWQFHFTWEIDAPKKMNRLNLYKKKNSWDLLYFKKYFTLFHILLKNIRTQMCFFFLHFFLMHSAHALICEKSLT